MITKELASWFATQWIDGRLKELFASIRETRADAASAAITRGAGDYEKGIVEGIDRVLDMPARLLEATTKSSDTEGETPKG